MDVVVDPPVVPFFLKSPTTTHTNSPTPAASATDSPVRPSTATSHMRSLSTGSDASSTKRHSSSTDLSTEGRALDEHAEAKQAEEAQVVNVSFMKAAIGVAVQAFRSAEPAVQAKVMLSLLECLAKIVVYQRKWVTVWAAAVTAIATICQDGVPSVNRGTRRMVGACGQGTNCHSFGGGVMDGCSGHG